MLFYFISFIIVKTGTSEYYFFNIQIIIINELHQVIIHKRQKDQYIYNLINKTNILIRQVT